MARSSTASVNNSVGQLLRIASTSLRKVSDAPQLDVERLLLKVLTQPESSWLQAHGDDTLTEAQASHFTALVKARASGKPLAYLLGEWHFYGRPFYISEQVLIPRPSTEALIDAALSKIEELIGRKTPGPLALADIGTGSGCIAVTLALDVREKISIIATDISEEALAMATKNAQRHGVLDRIEFLPGTMLEPVAERKIDLIVSNPPYVPTKEVARADASIDTLGLRYEPPRALDGGPDGKKFVRELERSALSAVYETLNGEIVYNAALQKKQWKVAW